MDETATVFRIDAADRGLGPIQHDSSDTAIAGARSPRAVTSFVDVTGSFTAGVWACDAGTLEIRNLAIDEACYLIEGEVIITDEAGNSEVFRQGEAFVLKRGFSGTWHMPTAIKKYNAMHSPGGGIACAEPAQSALT